MYKQPQANKSGHIKSRERDKILSHGWLGADVGGDPDLGNTGQTAGRLGLQHSAFSGTRYITQLGHGHDGPDKFAAAAKMIAVPLPEFICPTRRIAELYPYHLGLDPKTYNADWTSSAARTDYAVNRGVFSADVDAGDGPKTYDDPTYKWPDPALINGISFVRSMIQAKDISDGLSNTYLVGEKYVNAQEYTSGQDPGDNASLCQGDSSTSPAMWRLLNTRTASRKPFISRP